MPANNGKMSSKRAAPVKSGDGSAVPPRSNWLVFLLLLALNYFLVSLFFPGPQGPEPISYTAFRSELAKDNVEAIHTQGESIEGKFKAAIPWTPPAAEGQPAAEPRDVENFTTILPLFVDPGLETELIRRGVDIRATPIQTEANPLLTLLSAFGPALLIIGLYIWFFRRAAKQGGGMLGGLAASARAPRGASTRRRKPRSPSPTSPASTRPRTNSSRSSISSRTRRSIRDWEGPPRRACCWSARPGPARRCWPAP